MRVCPECQYLQSQAREGDNEVKFIAYQRWFAYVKFSKPHPKSYRHLTFEEVRA